MVRFSSFAIPEEPGIGLSAKVCRLGFELLFGMSLIAAAGCSSTAGWGPPPWATPAQIASAQSGAPAFKRTSAIGSLVKKQEAAKIPPDVRVQDCAVVAVSSPSRFACNGEVYTSAELARARQQAGGNN